MAFCDMPDLQDPITDRDHSIGPPAAPVSLVEYGDYECPNCLNAYPVIERLVRHFGDQIRFVFRHFPQNSIHPNAATAALVAEAAGNQGRFWDMHAALFGHQQDLGEVDFDHLALSLGLEIYRFRADLGRSTLEHRLRDHIASAHRAGVTRTPTLFLNDCRYAGPVEFDALVSAIQSLLKSSAH
jgi:protein-disulfide isomerase